MTNIEANDFVMQGWHDGQTISEFAFEIWMQGFQERVQEIGGRADIVPMIGGHKRIMVCVGGKNKVYRGGTSSIVRRVRMQIVAVFYVTVSEGDLPF